MADIYSYSIIRVVPDPRRGEWVNMGVVVYLPDRLDIHLLPSVAKLRVLAPGIDARFLTTLPDAWSRLCDGMEAAADRQAMLSRLPLAHASPTAQFLAGPNDYTAQVHDILQDLVIPRPAPARDARDTRVETTLKDLFKRARLLGSAVSDIGRKLVVHKYPIDRAAHLFADFARHDRTWRLTETIDFRVGPDALRQRHAVAALKSVTFNRARAVLDADCVPSVVYAVDTADLSRIEPTLNMLRDYADRLYDVNDSGDMADYMAMMTGP